MNGSSIFKKVLPVVLVIALICVIAVVTTSTKTGKVNTPEISNPSGEYVTIKETINGKEYEYVITRKEMYEELKNGIGLSTVVTEANKIILAKYMEEITDEEIEKEINEAKYGEDVDIDSLTDEEKAEKEKDYMDSMLSGYGYETIEEIKDHYRLVLAKEAYAKEKLAEESKDAEEDDDLYISEDDIDDYYKDNYNKSYYALIVPFTSTDQIKSSLLQLGVVRSGDKWLHAELKEVSDGSGIYEIEKGEALTTSEIITTIFKLHEMVYGYKSDYGFTSEEAVFDSENKKYTVPENCDYAYVSCLDKLNELKALIAELKNLLIPSDGDVLTAEEKTNALTKLTEVQSKLDEISNMLVFTDSVKKVQDAIDSLKKALEKESTENTETEKDETPSESTLIQSLIEVVENFNDLAYIFNTDSEDSKFYYSYSSLKEYDSNLPSEFKNNYIEYVPYANDDAEASVNGEKWFSASYVTSGDMYYIIMKIKENDAPQLADVKEEIKETLLNEKLTTTYIETKIAELRKEKDFKVFDSQIENDYISNLSSYDVKYKQSKKDGSNVVFEIDGTKFTSDDLFKAMDKTSGTVTVISELSYRRMLNNALFNTYYDPETGKWLGEEGKEKREEIKESIETQRLYYLSGAYSSYGYDPSSMSWEDFLKNINGASDEKELAYLNLYSQIVTDYLEKLMKTIYVSGEGKDTDFEETYEEALNSKVWNLIKERMENSLEEEFTVNGVHLLVSAYETVNDAVNANSSSDSSSSTTVSALEPKDWTEEQRTLAKELIKEVMVYLATAEGTYETKLQAVVSAYNNAPYAVKDSVTGEYVKIVNDSGTEYEYYLECAECKIDLAKYKSAGLTLTYQSLGSFSNGKMVEAFEEAAKSIWLKDYEDKAFNRVTVYNEAIETEFGYHLYVNLNSSNYTEYDSIKVDASGKPVYENEELVTEKSVLPSLYEIRLSLLLTALEAVDQTELSEEDAEELQARIDELKELYTTDIKTAVEKYATPIIDNLKNSSFASLVQQAEILEFLSNVTFDSPSGVNLDKITKIIEISKKSTYEDTLTYLKEADENVVKATDVYGK